MSDSSVCINIPNGVVYILVFGAVSAIVAAIGNVFGMSCPFLSNYMQNRIHHRNTGLLVNMNEQIDAQRNLNNV